MATVIDIKQVEIITAEESGTMKKTCCEICHDYIIDFDNNKEGNIHVIQPCQCKYFCTSCLKLYVHNNVQNRLKDGLLACPRTPKCDSYMTDNYIFRIADLKDNEKYLRWKIEADELKLAIKNNTLKKNKTIEKEEIDMLNNLGIKTKKCPKCFESIEKSDGCDHVRCPFCNTDFCWRCGTANLTGKYVRKCGTCNREFIDHIHTSHHRKVFCLTFILWFPLAIAYCLFCVACCTVCFPIMSFGEMEIESNVSTNDDNNNSIKSNNNNNNNNDDENISSELEENQEEDDINNTSTTASSEKKFVKHTCCNNFKMILSVILFPFIVVCQFSHIFDCDCLMPNIPPNNNTEPGEDFV